MLFTNHWVIWILTAIPADWNSAVSEALAILLATGNKIARVFVVVFGCHFLQNWGTFMGGLLHFLNTLSHLNIF